MALPHAKSGEIIDVRPLGSRLAAAVSNAYFKTPQLELMRLVIPSGKTMPEHTVPGPITIQCMEGTIELLAHQTTQTMHAGDLIYLAGGEPHALHAPQEDASVLVTVVLLP